ncbi:MAG: kelch repeat-containing protein [Ktedonobacteraceae bacterium]
MINQSQTISPRRLRVFLSYSWADKVCVRSLYQRLQACNVAPWLDEKNLLPGQDWRQEIRKAVRDSDVVVVCLSRGSINKTGFVHEEIKFALDVADEQPLGTIFIIPLKLEECDLPERIGHLHWVNYFEKRGFENLMRSLKHKRESLNIEVASIDYQPAISRRTVMIGLGLGLTSLVIGGVVLSRTVFSPSSPNTSTTKLNTWSVTGSMAIKRVGHSATLLQDGSVLVAGGNYAPSSLADFAEIYSPSSGTWFRTKGNLQTPRITITNSLVTLSNGQALFVGGANADLTVDYASTELYDPATGMWLESGSLKTPRRNASLVLLKGGQRVLIAAGAHGLPDGNRFLNSTEIYEVATGNWSYAPGHLDVARDGGLAVLLHDGRVLIAGGEGPWHVSGNTAELFDPQTGTWFRVGIMPWGWGGAAMTVLAASDERVFVCGGANETTTFANATLFNPSTAEWKQVASMHTPRAGHQATLLSGNRILVSGGVNASGTLPSSEIYDVATNTWSDGPNLHEPRGGHLAIMLKNGDVLVIGGSSTTGILASCELFRIGNPS